MTLEELLAKNAATRARREAEAQLKAAEEAQKQQEAINTKKKKGKKPANRAYLVVEPIDEEAPVEEEIAEEVKEEE